MNGHIQLSEEPIDRFRELKEYGDSYDDIVRQLDEQPIQEEDLSGDVEVVEEGPKGTVYKEYQTCGDESCHCMSGGEKHGPYKYRAYWRTVPSKKSISEKPSNVLKSE